MKICNKCGILFKDNNLLLHNESCPVLYCDGNIIDVDEDTIDVVRKMTKVGFIPITVQNTILRSFNNDCDKDDRIVITSIDFTNSCDICIDTAAKGFILSYNDERDIFSLNRISNNLSSIDAVKRKSKNICNLIEWLDEIAEDFDDCCDCDDCDDLEDSFSCSDCDEACCDCPKMRGDLSDSDDVDDVDGVNDFNDFEVSENFSELGDINDLDTFKSETNDQSCKCKENKKDEAFDESLNLDDLIGFDDEDVDNFSNLHLDETETETDTDTNSKVTEKDISDFFDSLPKWGDLLEKSEKIGKEKVQSFIKTLNNMPDVLNIEKPEDVIDGLSMMLNLWKETVKTDVKGDKK